MKETYQWVSLELTRMYKVFGWFVFLFGCFVFVKIVCGFQTGLLTTCLVSV